MVYQVATLIVFLVLFPYFIFICFFLVVLEGFPILFRQKRMGIEGKRFTLYKFRTMVNDAEQKKRSLVHQNEATGPVFKIHNDPRFTRIGKFLSHTGLDELPQLINVLRGEMAFIGPRPLPVPEAERLKPWMQKRHMVKPGIISPWVLEGYHRTSFEDWMKSDIAYAKSKSIQKDSILLMRAVFLLVRLIYKEVNSCLSSLV